MIARLLLVPLYSSHCCLPSGCSLSTRWCTRQRPTWKAKPSMPERSVAGVVATLALVAA
jgi:hypothetical protein